MKKLSILAASLALFFAACGGSSATDSDDVSSSNSTATNGILTDSRDGQKYKTTKIGEQVWMAENLNYAYLQPTDELDSSSFCYDNDPAMCKKYGRLYLWSAVVDSAGVLKNDGKGKDCGYGAECGVEGSFQGICPKGWHLPSKGEFETLLASVGVSGEERSEILGAGSWKNGMNKFSFSALPAGYYNSNLKEFYDLGDDANFWSSMEYDSGNAYCLYIFDRNAYVTLYEKYRGLSVRCLQDS